MSKKCILYLDNHEGGRLKRWLSIRRGKSIRSQRIAATNVLTDEFPEHLRRLRKDERFEVVLTIHNKPMRRCLIPKNQFGFIVDRKASESIYRWRSLGNFKFLARSYCGPDFEKQTRLDPLGDEEYILAVVRRVRV